MPSGTSVAVARRVCGSGFRVPFVLYVVLRSFMLHLNTPYVQYDLCPILYLSNLYISLYVYSWHGLKTAISNTECFTRLTCYHVSSHVSLSESVVRSVVELIVRSKYII